MSKDDYPDGLWEERQFYKNDPRSPFYEDPHEDEELQLFVEEAREARQLEMTQKLTEPTQEDLSLLIESISEASDCKIRQLALLLSKALLADLANYKTVNKEYLSSIGKVIQAMYIDYTCNDQDSLDWYEKEAQRKYEELFNDE